MRGCFAKQKSFGVLFCFLMTGVKRTRVSGSLEEASIESDRQFALLHVCEQQKTSSSYRIILSIFLDVTSRF